MQDSKSIAAIAIKSAVRGYLTRKKYSFSYPVTLIVRLQKFIRGSLVRNRLSKIHKSATKIQAFYKSKLFQTRYLIILASTYKIQNAIRRFLLKNRQIKESLSPFLQTEQAFLKNTQLLEHSELFSVQKPENPYHEQEVLKTLSTITESSAHFSHNQLLSTGSLALQLRQVSPFHLEKLCFFARPFELELLVDGTVVYDPIWSRQLELLNKELVIKDEQIMDVAVGNCHSMAVSSKGRVFVWGWNDKDQCGTPGNKARLLDLGKDTKAVQISCGNDHSLVLTTTGAVIAIGDNSKGQLGLGHYTEQKLPATLDLPPCKQVEAVCNQNLSVTTSGELYIWPFETIHGDKRSYPMRMLPEHLIIEVSVGFNFALILTTSGLLYSLGSNNKSGQLGHGDLQPRSSPTLILSLKRQGEKISNVSCGSRHVLARSTLGKLFSWGCGTEGQLGHGSNESEVTPKQVVLKHERMKPVQLSAGSAYSIVMMENRKILWTGKNSMICCNGFVEANVNGRIPELYKNAGEFAIVKVRSVWSRVLNLSMVTVVDLRYLQNVSASKLQMGLNMMAGKWSGKMCEPPAVESLVGYYPANFCKKVTMGKGRKVEDFKDRISEILKKPGEKWTAEERHTMEAMTKFNN